MTPSLIELSNGEQWEYFVALTIFLFILGGLQVLLFVAVNHEISLREILSGQPPVLGSIDHSEISKIQNSGSKVTLSPCGCVYDGLASDGEDDRPFTGCDKLIAKMCETCNERVRFINSAN